MGDFFIVAAIPDLADDIAAFGAMPQNEQVILQGAIGIVMLEDLRQTFFQALFAKPAGTGIKLGISLFLARERQVYIERIVFMNAVIKVSVQIGSFHGTPI